MARPYDAEFSALIADEYPNDWHADVWEALHAHLDDTTPEQLSQLLQCCRDDDQAHGYMAHERRCLVHDALDAAGWAWNKRDGYHYGRG